MPAKRVSLAFLLGAVVFSPAFMLASCAPRVTKGSVYREVSKGIRAGADKSEVIKYVDSLKVNGARPTKYDYVRDTSGYPVVAPGGKEVEVEGTMSTSFSNGISFFSFCIASALSSTLINPTS